MLNAHPDIRIVHEPELFRTIRKLSLGDSFSIGEFNRRRIDLNVKLRPSFEEHLDILSSDIGSEVIFTVSEFYNAMFGCGEEKIIGDKSLQNGFNIKMITNYFPNAVVFHMVRDPRDTILSNLIKKGHSIDDINSKSFFSKIINQSFRWKEWNMLMNKPVQNLHTIKYEDVINNSSEVVANIAQILGVSGSEKMLDMARRADTFTSLHEQAKAFHTNLNKEIDSEKIGKGCSELAMSQIQWIEWGTSPMLKKMGFEKIHKPLSPFFFVNLKRARQILYNRRQMKRLNREKVD